jgi:hypothetical protein
MLYRYRFFHGRRLVTANVPEATLAALWGTELVDEVLNEVGRVPEN